MHYFFALTYLSKLSNNQQFKTAFNFDHNHILPTFAGLFWTLVRKNPGWNERIWGVNSIRVPFLKFEGYSLFENMKASSCRTCSRGLHYFCCKLQ